MQYIHRNWTLVLWAPAIVALGCFGPAPQSARAQNSVAGWPDREYKQVPPKVVPFNTLVSVLKAGKFENDEEEKFTNYFNQQLFPNVTNPANRQSRDDVIAKLRIHLKACETRPEQQVFNKLTDLTLAYMTKIAQDGHYHPVARVNAVLAIGEVNSPKAAKVLLDTAFGKGQVFAVRVAAMTGLVRMAGPSGKGVLSDPGIAPLVLTDMLALFHTKTKNDGIYWMRGQAADVFAELGNVGPKGEVPDVLRTMLKDKDIPIPLRSKAARALGKLNYDNLPPADEYLAALAQFADDAFSSEQPADRGRVRLVVHDVEEGMKPFAKAPNDQALSDGLQKALKAIRTETEDKMTPDELKDAIAKAKKSLDALLKNKR
jgi:hypothetical protein